MRSLASQLSLLARRGPGGRRRGITAGLPVNHPHPAGAHPRTAGAARDVDPAGSHGSSSLPLPPRRGRPLPAGPPRPPRRRRCGTTLRASLARWRGALHWWTQRWAHPTTLGSEFEHHVYTKSLPGNEQQGTVQGTNLHVHRFGDFVTCQQITSQRCRSCLHTVSWLVGGRVGLLYRIGS
jgi:hypothetical protein